MTKRSVDLSALARSYQPVEIGDLTDDEKNLLATNPQLFAIAKMLESQTGKKVNIDRLIIAESNGTLGSMISSSPIYDYHRRSYESNGMQFRSSGTAKLADGSEIKFELNIAWLKEFAVENRFAVQDGKILTDPLVVSFGANEPLIGDTFAFNLSSDVKQLNFTSASGGYLVYDKNKDGVINDGSELFGPATGKGFLELAKYDQDKNGWIDSNDEIFKQLKIWVVRQDGDALFSLEEAGVGAISLKTTEINYTAKDSIDNTFAHYKNASVALGENGGTFGVFEVDLAV